MPKTAEKIVYWLFSIFVALTIGYSLYMLAVVNKNTYVTVKVELAEVDDSMSIHSNIVRDEELLFKEQGLYCIPVSKASRRVSSGQTIAVYFNSTESLKAYYESVEIEKKLSNLEGVKTKSDYADIKQQNNDIYDALRKKQEDGLYDASKNTEALFRAMLTRETTLGQYETLDIDIANLKLKKYQLTTKIGSDIRYIPAEKAGYYTFSVDGMEQYLRPDLLLGLTAEEYKMVASMPPAAVSDRTYGKMIYGYKWYAAALVRPNQASALSENNSYFIEIEGNKYAAKLEKITPSKEENEFFIIFSSEIPLVDVDSSRSQITNVILASYKGFKIPYDAMRVQDGISGVFVLEGAVAVFKPVNILHSSKNYYIVEAYMDDTKQLFMNDELILGRKDLFDGKILR